MPTGIPKGPRRQSSVPNFSKGSVALEARPRDLEATHPHNPCTRERDSSKLGWLELCRALQAATPEIETLSVLKYWAYTPSDERDGTHGPKEPKGRALLRKPEILEFSPPQISDLNNVLGSDYLDLGESELAHWVSKLPIGDPDTKKNLMRNIRAEWAPKCWRIMEEAGFPISDFKRVHEIGYTSFNWNQARNKVDHLSVMGRSLLEPRNAEDTPPLWKAVQDLYPKALAGVCGHTSYDWEILSRIMVLKEQAQIDLPYVQNPDKPIVRRIVGWDESKIKSGAVVSAQPSQPSISKRSLLHRVKRDENKSK